MVGLVTTVNIGSVPPPLETARAARDLNSLARAGCSRALGSTSACWVRKLKAVRSTSSCDRARKKSSSSDESHLSAFEKAELDEA